MLALALLGGCRKHTTDFFEVRPTRDVPALANKSLDEMHGMTCASICTTRSDYDSINYCAIATVNNDTEPFLVCSFHDERDAPYTQ
jgi:hypothetical protein